MKCICKEKKVNRDIRYEAEVQAYFYKNIYIIIDGLHKLPALGSIRSKDLIKIVGKDFPRYYRYVDNDKKQIEKFFKTIKLTIKVDEKNNYLRKIFNDYYLVVKNYLLFSGSGTVSTISDLLEKKGNKILFNDINTLLGNHYPKIEIARECDERIPIIFFLYNSGLIFKYDSMYIYFA